MWTYLFISPNTYLKNRYPFYSERRQIFIVGHETYIYQRVTYPICVLQYISNQQGQRLILVQITCRFNQSIESLLHTTVFTIISFSYYSLFCPVATAVQQNQSMNIPNKSKAKLSFFLIY